MKLRTSSLISKEKSSWMKRYVWCEPVRHRLLGMVLVHEEFGGSKPVWPGAEVGLPFSCPQPSEQSMSGKKNFKTVFQILLEPFLTCDLGMGALKIAKSSTGSTTL